MSKEHQPICDTCNKVITIKHLIIIEECIKYSAARYKMNKPPTTIEAVHNENH